MSTIDEIDAKIKKIETSNPGKSSHKINKKNIISY